MKHHLLFFALLLTCAAQAQRVYLADTAFTTDVGYDGAPASCVAPHMEYKSWQMDRTRFQWVADAFTIPADSTWTFDTVIVYGYQYGSGNTSPFLSCNLQIFGGEPGAGGSVIWGDTLSNVMVSTGFTGIYKVDTMVADGGLTGTTRPIMYLKLFLSPAPSLSAGTYWLSWAAVGLYSGTEPADAPDKVLPGRVNPSGQVARQFYSNTWHNIVDSGNAVGMDMMIIGGAAVSGVTTINEQASPVLGQNIPDPAGNTTSISYYLQNDAPVKLCVYDAVGRKVATLADREETAGTHTVSFDVDKLACGVYFYSLATPTGITTRQMVVAR
jgi:hypothetical protein